MQFIQPKRSKYKKCTKNYVQDNLLDIIDIEETLSKNRYISKVQKSEFLYAKFLPKYESSKLLSQAKPLILKSFSKEKLLSIKEPKSPATKSKLNNNISNDQKHILLFNPDYINYEVLNKNKFDINFKRLKLEYKNGYRVLFTKEYYPIEIIGAGAFGLVVNVIQIKTGQKMAVKIINKNNVNDNSNADHLIKEVRILKNLDNPRIMKIYDILDNHHYFFIFMELIEGGNLKDLIIKRYLDNNVYLFRDSECAQIMKGIFEAINYLHKNNIIHRDIKPENILFKNKDDLSSVILCDFGLAYQLNEYENSISGSCGTTIYMAPEILLKKNYDYLVDSFSAGIVLYILCSGGKHPFYTRGTPQKEYIEKLIQQKCLCKFSNEMPLLARNLFLKLCKFESIFRYEVYKALDHPWITRSTKSQIPMTILEEYNKSDKIKTFQSLLSSVVSLAILKKYFKIRKKKEEFSKNNSYYENLEKTSLKSNLHQILNMHNIPDKHLFLTGKKKSGKFFFKENNDEKRISPKKLGTVNTTLFNIKTTKNLSKKLEPPILSKPNYFVKTGINYTKSKNNYNKNYNREGRNILRTHSFEENDEYKEKDQQDPQQKYISKSKTHSKYKHMKSSSGHIIINHINQNKDNNTIQCSIPRKNSNNCIRMNLSGNKYSNIQNNKIFLKKHIVIESKNKNMVNDNRKNNNSSINSSNTKNKIDTNNGNNYNLMNNELNKLNFSDKMNLQMNKNNSIKDYNQISDFQTIFSGTLKHKSKNLVLKEMFNGSDF
jgi:serine/threonine protein kinase